MTISSINVTTGEITETQEDAPSFVTAEQVLEAAIEEIVQIEEQKRLDALRAQAAADLSDATSIPAIEAVLARKRPGGKLTGVST